MHVNNECAEDITIGKRDEKKNVKTRVGLKLVKWQRIAPGNCCRRVYNVSWALGQERTNETLSHCPCTRRVSLLECFCWHGVTFHASQEKGNERIVVPSLFMFKNTILN